VASEPRVIERDHIERLRLARARVNKAFDRALATHRRAIEQYVALGLPELAALERSRHAEALIEREHWQATVQDAASDRPR
jgi:hypothetical protein